MAKQEVHGIEISIRRGFGPWLLATALMMAAAPVAAVDLELDDDEFTGNEDETIVRNVLTNDSDDDGFPFFVAENTDPGNGTVTFDASGTMTYTPVDGFSGVDIFDYTVRSLDPACFFGGPPECTATATVVLTVRADADLPLLSASNATGDEDSAITLTLSAASNDPDGSEELRAFIGNLSPGTVLSAGSPVGPSTWEVPIAVLGGLTVTPPPNTNGVVTLNFSVLATDSAFDLDGDLINEDSTNANVSFQVSVAPVDDPPTIVGAIPAVLGSEDAELIVDLNPIFEDPDSPLSLSVGAVTNPAIETAIISGLQLRLRPFADANGTGSVEVIANAPDPGDSVSINIAVDIDQVNDTPVVDEPLLNVDVDEDSGTISVSLADAFDDVDIDTNGDSLGFTVTSSDATLFSAIATSGTATELTLAENANGNALITVVAEDTEGATATQTFNVNVNPVNDAPFEILAIPSETVDEDDGTVSYLLTDHFDDVDILTNGDVLTFSIESNSAPELFAPAEVVGKLLELTPAPDANGVANIVVKADDGEASETISFTLTINAINDIPEANADAFTMAEDEPALVLDVLANDYLAEEPVVIVSAGTDGFSDSGTAFSYLNATGDIVEGPNGTVAIVDNSIVYQPKPNFYGEDTFSYVIRDESGAGDLSEPAVVTITVTPENDPPEGEAVKTYVMFANESISIPLDEGVTRDAYDLDYALIDPDTGDVVGGGYTAALVTLPSAGGTFSFATDGSFTYTPPADYTGVSTFTYRLQDAAISSEGEYEARIVVLEAPEAAVPPAPGEVAVPHNLASTPLEQATGVTPNVLIMMDDSGSMDWDITTFSAGDEGVMRLDNGDIRSDGADRTTYHYVWQLPGNTYSATSNSGRSLPTEEALDGNTTTDDNEYGVWRARNSQFNVLYYDPSVRYDPWIGYDSSNTLYGPADPNAIRLDPADPTSTLDMLADFTYDADNVPQWDSDGGTEDLSVTVYIPRYYTTTATGLPEWNSPHTLVEIRDGAGPLAGGMFPGGSNRFDCAGDGDSSDCTYAEEIQNFANWLQYYRKREYVAKASVAAVLEDVDDLRVGYETLNRREDFEIAQMNALISEGNKKDIMDTVFDVNSSGGTPLRRALQDAGEIYRCTYSGRDCPILAEPDGTCQQNFTLLFSDGYWNSSAGVADNQDNDGDGPWDGGRYADTLADTLADTAMFYYENDLQPLMEDAVAPTAKDLAGRVVGEFATNERMHQHMKTFTVAFGILGSIDPTTVPTDATEAFTWPSPFSSDAAKIDDMLHAAVNGRGEFLSASRPTELRRVVEDAFEEFSNAQSSVSAAAFNSTSLRDGTFLFRGSYDLADNSGELTATLVSTDGVVATTPLWSAAGLLDPSVMPPADRRIVTFNRDEWEGRRFRFDQLTADQLLGLNEVQLDWIRGDRSQETDSGGSLRDRDSLRMLGDIVNSSPVFVGQPRAINRDQAPYPTGEGQLYSEFKEANESRTGVVYVGANDGMLHGFEGNTGEELFAYLPNTLFDGTARFASEMRELTDPFYSHRYYVDLTPRLNDVFIATPTDPQSWRTVMIGGLGAGGKGYYALDLTDPTQFASDGAAEDLVLWEFTEADDTYPVAADGTPFGGAIDAVTDPDGLPVKDLGYALSLPTIAMSNVVGGDGENEWIAIFGNGQNSTAGIAKLFALFVEAGIDGWADGDFVKIDTGFGVPISDPPEWVGYPNGLGSPTVVDQDLNGTVDLVYAGDKLGNLYRFDLTSDDPDDWKAILLFTASYTDGFGVERRQAVLNRPLVTPHPTKPGFLVIFGTGSYFADEDASDDAIQSIYGIWDPVATDSPFTALDDSKALRLVEQTISNVVDDGSTPLQTRRVVTSADVNYTSESGTPGVYGWYIDLDMPRATTTLSGAVNPDTSGNAPPATQFPGERAIRRLVLRNGNIITTTVLPTTGEASCFGTRPGSILIFNAANGGNATSPVIDFNRDGVVDDLDLVDVDGSLLAGGLLLNSDELDGSLVDLSTLGGDGDTDFLFVSGGTDTVSFRIEELVDDRTGRLSWRELQND